MSTFPDSAASKRGYLALQRSFPAAGTDPAHIVVVGSSGDVAAATERLRDRLASDPRFGRGEIRIGEGGITDLVVPVRGDPASDAAVSAVRDLRKRIVPEAYAGTAADPLIGGTTAENIDYFDGVTDPAPIVFAFVLGLSLVLLTVAFRSVVVALTAIVLNLLSVGAAYGLLVLVFQHGWGADVRSVVLPSAMTLLGDRNWYLPRWLEWIPHLEVEGHAAPESNTAPST